jgi:hypothetical protein
MKAGPIEFNKANKELAQSDSAPPGDWNMYRRRAQ